MFRRIVLMASVAGLLAVIAAPAANAVVGNLVGTYSYVNVKSNGVVLGELYSGTLSLPQSKVNLFYRQTTDAGGDRLEVKGKVRDLLPTNAQAVYAQGDKWNDGFYCYVSGIGADSASTSCQSSWHPDSDDVQYTPYKSSTWANVDFNYGRTASMNSQRYDLRVCEDEPLFLPDICGGSRVLGIDWN